MLAKLDQRSLALISVGLSLIIWVIWFTALAPGVKNQTEAVKTEIQQLQTDREKGRSAQRALPELKAAIADLDDQKQIFLAQLPQQEELSNLLLSLNGKIAARGINLKSFGRSQAQAKVQGVQQVNLNLQMESTFAQLYSFLNDLEALQRFTTVSGLNLSLASVAEPGEVRIGSSLTLSIFAYQSQPAGGNP